MVMEVIVTRDNTMISKNPAANISIFGTVGVERICMQKRKDTYWFHIFCHCYGLQVSKNGILYIDSDISCFMMGYMAFTCAKNQLRLSLPGVQIAKTSSLKTKEQQ